jgi:murein DD-endopeptidase MepM/ murein hydrolase activator NlpD
MPLLPAMLLLIIGTVLLLYNRTNISSLMQRNVVSLAPLEDSGAANMASVMNIPGVSETGIAAVPDPTTHIAIPEAVVPHINITEGTVAEEAQDDIPLKMVDYFSWIDHTVKSGESVSRIADSYGLSMETVIASNNLTNAHLLRPGQILKIPNMNGIPYVIKSGDNLSKISKAWSIPLSVIVDANNLQSDFIMPGQTIFLPGARMPANDLRMALGTLFVSPLKGSGSRLSSAFGWREDPFDGGQRLHEAIDMAAPTGTPVKAASSGRVSMVGNSPTYGKYIIISHSGGFQTLYAHLSVIVVQQGAQVDQGTKIGEVGSTGRSTGPHLHFALYKDDKAVNPLDYLSM